MFERYRFNAVQAAADFPQFSLLRLVFFQLGASSIDRKDSSAIANRARPHLNGRAEDIGPMPLLTGRG
jgi:hypothetical protein